MIRRATNPVTRLNAFQRVMLQWSELHPYNAAHTYQLSGPLHLRALQRAIRDAFLHNGLGTVEIDSDGTSFRHVPEASSDQPEVSLIAGDSLPADRLTADVTRELNVPFERPRCRPFRFRVIEAGPTSHYITLVYDHWVADSVGARLVMRHVLGRYLDLHIPENEEMLDLCPGTYREVFAHRLRGRNAALPMLRSFRSWLAHRSTCRVAYASTRELATGYAVYEVQPGTADRLRHFARQNGASVNDVFLSALSRAMVSFLPKRFAKSGANDMAIGTIVDTRRDATDDLSESLGTFLGYYLVRVAGDGNIGLGNLARRVAAITSVQKARRSYLDSAVNLSVASAIWPRLKPESRPFFARRALPLTAGISNVHLRGTWIEQHAAGRILDFRRAVSNGPSLPLVISPTTIQDRMNIGVSYRVTGFARPRIDGIMQAFVEQLERLDSRAKIQKPAKTK